MVLPAPSFNKTFDLWPLAARFELGYSLHLNKNLKKFIEKKVNKFVMQIKKSIILKN